MKILCWIKGWEELVLELMLLRFGVDIGVKVGKSWV